MWLHKDTWPPKKKKNLEKNRQGFKKNKKKTDWLWPSVWTVFTLFCYMGGVGREEGEWERERKRKPEKKQMTDRTDTEENRGEVLLCCGRSLEPLGNGKTLVHAEASMLAKKEEGRVCCCRHFLTAAILERVGGISHYNAFRFGSPSLRPVLICSDPTLSIYSLPFLHYRRLYSSRCFMDTL